MERSERVRSSDLSENDTAKDVALGCRSGDGGPGNHTAAVPGPPGIAGGTPAEGAAGGVDTRCNGPLQWCSRSMLRSSAGSELECPTRICPERSDDDCDLLPSERCDEV
mmetsp:Transcript_157793/g.506049  ORF Transcript_157793/g.506049 Transcript_157793/m.506049 type:complete len:109 (-) Transcript_157793:400-726(-)